MEINLENTSNIKYFNFEDFNLDGYKNETILTGIDFIDKLTEGGLEMGKLCSFTIQHGKSITLITNK